MSSPLGTSVSRPVGTSVSRPIGTSVSRLIGTSVSRPIGIRVSRPVGTVANLTRKGTQIYHLLLVGRTQPAVLCRTLPARGRVGRVTDCGVRGLGFKSKGSILTSGTETSSLSRVVRDG